MPPCLCVLDEHSTNRPVSSEFVSILKSPELLFLALLMGSRRAPLTGDVTTMGKGDLGVDLLRHPVTLLVLLPRRMMLFLSAPLWQRESTVYSLGFPHSGSFRSH